MDSLEKLHELYARSGITVSMREIYELHEKYGYRVGLPGHVIARTLVPEIASFLMSLEGSQELTTEKDVADFIAGRLRDQISNSSK